MHRPAAFFPNTRALAHLRPFASFSFFDELFLQWRSYRRRSCSDENSPSNARGTCYTFSESFEFFSPSPLPSLSLSLSLSLSQEEF